MRVTRRETESLGPGNCFSCDAHMSSPYRICVRVSADIIPAELLIDLPVCAGCLRASESDPLFRHALTAAAMGKWST